MSTTIAFPPPPTSNSLSRQQRNQLLRTTKKLGQVLGSTPHLVDGSYPIDSVDVYPPRRLSPEHVPLSITDMRRTNSHSSVTSRECTPPRTTSASARSSNYAESVNAIDSWRIHHPSRLPPLLRLALDTPSQGPPITGAAVSPALDPIPSSPPANTRYTLTPAQRSTFSSQEDDSSHKASTDAGLRVAKMERVRRRLGEGVPVDLVFPDPTSEKKSSKLSRRRTAPPPQTSLFIVEETLTEHREYRDSIVSRDDASEVPLLKSKRRTQRREFSAKNLNEPVGFLNMGMRC